MNGDGRQTDASGNPAGGCVVGVLVMMCVAALAMSIIALAIAGC